MRITNDCSPEKMLAELFRAVQTTREDTVKFSDPSWSNHDVVCEKLKNGVDVMLRSYERLGNQAHVTQSMRDNGVDILLTCDEVDKSTRRIGIQVKSNREAVAAIKKKRAGESMEATLKRQAFEAQRWGLDEWWVLLCFDMTEKAHVDLINRINSELLQSNSSTKIRIYEPTDVVEMLNMEEGEIDAMCVRKLCREDEILTAAQAETGGLSTGAYAAVMGTLFNSLDEFGRHSHSLDDLISLTDMDNCHDLQHTSDVLDE